MADNVFTGFWINWEDGQVRGATLTLPTYQGLVLVSFLTLFVQFSGACFWRVICFILHQFRSTTTPRDGLFHQQQSILRNATTAPNALWSLTRSAFRWRNKVKAAIWNSLPLLTITIVHLAFFAAAGLLSSRVTSTTVGQALVRSGKCGTPPELANVRAADTENLTGKNLDILNTEVVLGRLTLSKSAAYVRTCYNASTNGDSAACNLFVKSYLSGINSSAVSNATCPFGSNACATPTVVRYDSGVLHSNEDLGINRPTSESLSMRRVTTCAPVQADKYATDWQDDVRDTYADLANTSAKYYKFGTAVAGCESTDDLPDLTTFCVTKYQKQSFQEAYTVRANTAYYNNGTAGASDFDPIPDFNIPNADTTLISIFIKAQYVGNVTDPLFKASNQSLEISALSTADNDLSILGCTEQYQFCNLGNNKCTELTGLYGIKQAIEQGDLSLSPKQQATYTVMWKAAWSMGLQWAVTVLSGDVLRAQDWVFTVKSLTSSPLPPTQWETEAYNLHNISLAVFQRRINEYASPENFEIRPGVNSLDQIIQPTDPNLIELCGMQKIRSSDHYAVSVLGMGIILGVGSLLILLDWIILQQIFWFRSFTNGRHTRKADWTNTGTLQLQRQALEARGVGPWNAKDYEFPVLVEKSRTFAGLGTPVDAAIPLDHLHDCQWGYGQEQGIAYKGERYEPVSRQRSDSDLVIHVGNDKGRDGEHI